ncbi:uncharacterized protein LOC133715767 [Rosa rugosa]|uniref:uncharacterized protein LOC133715767 n=1 Tax=Rosa rugosa TaxID=74645 RepID=UPI002B4149E6|nr:uncharacterized protein LOC133715767 [Rosa rugosa]
MDFHTLTRKALQALCKQNGIPANITNVAMADSLSALQHVEGLEELLNQSPEKVMIGSASVSRTAARTTTRRKAVNEEPESSQPLTRTTRRAATKKTVVEEVDQEKTEVPPKTPAAPSTRRRAPAASARQKTETLTETTSVQRAYSTRRSVRLLGKTMANMSLDKDNTMTSSIDELSADTMDCSEQSESSVVKGSDTQTVSEGTSNGLDASEVSSELKSNGQVVDESLLKESRMDVTEDGSMQKSGMESEMSAPKSASDVIMISEVMGESNEESSAEDKEPHCEGAQDLVVAKDSDHVAAVQSALPQEVNEPPSAVKTVEPTSLTLSSTPTKSPASKSSDVNVAATVIEPKEAPKAEALGDYSGKFDFESGSSTEGDSEDEGTEDEAVAEASYELQDNMNDTREANEEEDSDYESTEGESSEEEDSDDDITEEESSEDEAVADKPEKQSAQKSLIVENAGANMSEAAEVAKAEVFATMTKTFSPLPVNLATQFPRPTSAKSSGKKRPEIAMYISDDNEESLDTSTEMDKDEDLEGVEMKKKDEVIAEKESVKEFEAKSLRQLKKLLKKQLNIGDSKDTKVAEKPRIALSEVPENQMAVKEN